MNMSATSSEPAARSQPREPSTAAPTGTTQNHPARERFERALQARQQRQEPCEESECGEETPSDGPTTPWATPFSMPMPPRAAALPATPWGPTAPTDPSGTRKGIEASLSSSPGQAVTPLAGTNPAALWEVSVREPNAVAVQVRAERTGNPGSQATWGLTIGSPAANVDMLVRHAPRLNERLRKHAIGLDHVRVEQADEDDQ